MIFLDIQTVQRGITVIMSSDGSILFLDDNDYWPYLGMSCEKFIIQLKERGIFIQTVLLHR